MSDKNWLLVISLGCVWRSSFYYTEVLLNHFNPFMIVFLRVSIASLILILICFFVTTQFAFNLKDIFCLLVMGLFNNALPFSLIVIGQQSVTGGVAAILNSFTAFLAILVASCFFKDEYLTWNRVTGVLLGIAGVSVIVGVPDIESIATDGPGEFLILFATLSYAFAGIWAKKHLGHLKPVVSSTGMLLAGSVLMIAVLWFTDSFEPVPLNSQVVFHVLGYALIATVVAYPLYYKILETTGAGNLLVCTIIIAPAAVLLDLVLLGQYLSVNEFPGMLVITLGLLILDGRIFRRFRAN